MNKMKTFLLSASAMFILAACGDTATTEDTAVEEPVTEEEVATDVVTQEDLAAADGQDGNPAYIAIDGVVYDVTDHEAWENGEHNDLPAGNEYTSEIQDSPHGDSVLEDLPVVGTLE